MRASLRVARFDAGARAERQRHGGAAACGAPSRPIARSGAGAVARETAIARARANQNQIDIGVIDDIRARVSSSPRSARLSAASR